MINSQIKLYGDFNPLEIAELIKKLKDMIMIIRKLTDLLDGVKSKNKKDWENISKRYKLSEEFIKEFQNKVDWEAISKYQELSEEFIKEFQDKVCWYQICEYQKLSKTLLESFRIKLTGIKFGNTKN